MWWQSLHDAWWRLATQPQPRSLPDALACCCLDIGSLPYRAAVGLRNAAFDAGWAPTVRLACPVVSVGNLTLGGTGKTACVELIAGKLSAQGHRVAVLSRGYGGPGGSYTLQWQDGRLLREGATGAPPESLADEPQLLARRLPGVPVLVGARRDRTGQAALDGFGATALILDDGFQHRRLRRDCDILLVHARMPFSGWAVLPRGPMREPISAVRRADIIIITKADEALQTLGALTERLRGLNPRAVIITASHAPASLTDAAGQAVPLGSLEGQRVGAVSSIGDPDGFEATLRRMHASVGWHLRWPDHHRYAAADVARIRAALGDRVAAVVTTEKDWVRLRPRLQGQDLGVPVRVLGVKMAILDGETELDARLAGVRAR